MFKIIHILDDEDIEKGVEFLKSKDAPAVIILDIQGTGYLFKTEEALDVMENSLQEAKNARINSPGSDGTVPEVRRY